MWRESRTQHLWRGDDGRRLSRRDSREGRGALSRSIGLSPPPTHTQSHTHSSPPTPNSFGTGGSKRREGDYFPTQNRRKRPKNKAFTIVHTEKLTERGIFATPPSLPRQGKSFPLVDFWGWGLPPPSVFAKKWALGANMTNPVWTKKNGEENVVGKEREKLAVLNKSPQRPSYARTVLSVRTRERTPRGER